jgi:hypothetical protein
MNRPNGLTVSAILLALSGTWGLATLDYSKPHVLKRFFIFTTFICIGYVVIWFYWKGRNWARISVLLSSGASIFNLVRWNKVSPVLLTAPTHVAMGGGAILGVFLLYYLNTRPIVEFFYPEGTKSKYGWGRILMGLWIIATTFQHYFPAPSPLIAAHRAALTAPTIGTFGTMFVGICLFAWGARAGIVPYQSVSRRSAYRQS